MVTTRILATVALILFALSCFVGWFWMALFWGGVLWWAEVRCQFARLSVERERMSA